MKQVWSDENKYQKWLDVELAVSEAWAEEGVIPESDMKLLRTPTYNHDRMMEIFETTRHDVTAFLTSITETLGPEGRWLLLGMTSNDMLDTAQAMQMVQAGELLIGEVDKAIEALAEQALKHKDTLMMGRTHGVHAEPITFGLKMALWSDEIDRRIHRFEDAIKSISIGKISGAVGTYQHLDPKVEEEVCEKLGIKAANVSNQVVQRDGHAHFLQILSL